MERLVGTVSRGVRAPIIRQGDDMARIVVDSVLAAAESEGFSLRDRDVIGVTEAVVARSQGNYATVDQIAKDVRAKLGGGTVGVLFPILSRNRFAICLKGIASGCRKVVLMLSYPSDEVGNHLISEDDLDASGVNPWSDVLTEERSGTVRLQEAHLYRRGLCGVLPQRNRGVRGRMPGGVRQQSPGHPGLHRHRAGL